MQVKEENPLWKFYRTKRIKRNFICLESLKNIDQSGDLLCYHKIKFRRYVPQRYT